MNTFYNALKAFTGCPLWAFVGIGSGVFGLFVVDASEAQRWWGEAPELPETVRKAALLVESIVARRRRVRRAAAQRVQSTTLICVDRLPRAVCSDSRMRVLSPAWLTSALFPTDTGRSLQLLGSRDGTESGLPPGWMPQPTR
jgi:hypothetical protein